MHIRESEFLLRIIGEGESSEFIMGRNPFGKKTTVLFFFS